MEANAVKKCDCDTRCPTSPNCTCLLIISTGKCTCDCDNVAIEPLKTLKAEEPVNLCIRDNELGVVAEFVQRATGADVLVPAADMRKPISIGLEGVTFAEAMDQIGLVLGRPPESAA